VMELPEFKIEFHGPAATHNLRCPVCCESHAVYCYNSRDGGHFKPCWDCQIGGWKITRRINQMFWIGLTVGLLIGAVIGFVLLVYVDRSASGPNF